MNEELNLANSIVKYINQGILEDFDSFDFTAELGNGYIELDTSVTSNRRFVENPKTDFDTIELYSALEAFQKCFHNRGENWHTVIFSSVEGGKIKTKFLYD